MITTLSLIRVLCERHSGRTTEIFNQLTEFLAKNFNETVIVVLHRREMVYDYLDRFSKWNPNYSIMTIQSRVKNFDNNTVVMFLTQEQIQKGRALSGLRIKEVYFDTPEFQFFETTWMNNLLCRVQPPMNTLDDPVATVDPQAMASPILDA